MRLENFESAGLEPIGEGEENRVFVNPQNETRVISERKESAEKNTFRQMKGKFYLTKIVHALLPKHIPDIYQVTETSSGQQTIDREYIVHSESHARLQNAKKNSDVEMEQAAGQVIIDEAGEKINEVDSKLEDLGLAFCIDKNLGNYIKDDSGGIHYLETFNPWQADPVGPGSIEVLFNEETLREAIEKIPDEKTKIREKCEGYLKRLMTLVNEESNMIPVEIDAQMNREEMVKLEAEFASFESNHPIDLLMSITDAGEARKSEERTSAKRALGPLLASLNLSRNENYITAEQYLKFNERYQRFSRAVGMLNGGTVDHTR
ncbi:MAG: hypothetical protein K9M11_02520 [Candidatus Pacebacteria bacterium]|nr:hypothetical protein [Candidatus Paceibacterota bacterium]